MLMRVDLPREVPSATLSYSVKFDEGYDWTAGGKLPGLCDSGALLSLLTPPATCFKNNSVQCAPMWGLLIFWNATECDAKLDGVRCWWCDADCPTGCKNMDEHPGWSSRIMFRPGGAAESYMYYPNMKDFGTCGKSWPTPFNFSPGAWHQVTLYIKLNEGGTRPSTLSSCCL